MNTKREKEIVRRTIAKMICDKLEAEQPISRNEKKVVRAILSRVLKGEDVREYLGVNTKVGRPAKGQRNYWIAADYWYRREFGNDDIAAERKDDVVRPVVSKRWGLSESRVYTIASEHRNTAQFMIMTFGRRVSGVIESALRKATILEISGNFRK